MDSTMSRYMRSHWDGRARTDAFHYVETAHWAGDVEAFFALGEERARLFLDPVLARLGAARGTALDLGCGVGRFTRALGSRFAQVVGVDVSEVMVRKAAQLHPGDVHPNISFRVSDGLSLPLPDDSIDFAFSYEVFQHLPSHAAIAANVKEVGRVLRAGGAGLLHFKTPSGGPSVKQFYLDHVPDWADGLVRRMLGRDHRKADAAFRGAPPLTLGAVRAICTSGGLEVLDTLEDATHPPGTRIFVIVRATG
ncbi:class I SAM-dependent methyltransferase [Falsiroseomonas sp.]|uniref:class I SAM-dependent methyltransferase n=1 Tax=Falsiroseomonas sp. TaxID=2870721 RepID=UPI0035632C29